MAKTPSRKLFKLVKSLSGSERRYFKLAVNPTGDKHNKYARLFESIRLQEEFDDEALQLQIYGHKQKETRKYSELKNYLYGQILKSLQSFDEKTSVEYRIGNHFRNIKVLFKRSLFSECKDEIEKAKKIALKYELFSEMLELLRLEKELAYAKTDISFLDKNLEKIAAFEKECLQAIGLLIDLRNLFFQLLLELRKDVSRGAEQMKRLEKLAESEILKLSEHSESYRISVLYFRITSILKFARFDLNAFHKLSTHLLALMESKSHFLKEDVSEYISALNNHILSCGQLEKYEEVEQCLHKLKQIEPITSDDELKIHRQYYLIKLRYCIEKGDFEEGLTELKNHRKTAEKYPEFSFSKNSFYLQYFNIYFGAGDYEEALHFLNEWLEQPRNVERKDLQALARVLNLLVHYEMKNFILLDSLIRSAGRYLKKEKRIYQFEMHIMNFFHDIINKPKTKKELKQERQKLQLQFESLIQSPSESRMMRMFDFPSWIQSKISEKSFAQVKKESFIKKSTLSSVESDR